jgi:type IV pilus assembly protein PilM
MFGRTVAWGLDIGSATIKAIKLAKTGSGVAVVDFDVVEIEYSEDDSTRPARVKAALAELAKRKKFGRIPVFFSVPGNQVFFRPFNLPAVGDRKVDEIVNYEARQQVPFALEEVVWDYQVSPVGPSGELTVSLVAIRKEIVDRLLDSLREFNLNVVGLAPSPIAVLNYVSYDLGPAETSLILDAGAKVTDFVILHSNGFWFRPLPIAGEDITHVFEQKFRMPHAEAESLKLKIGESKQAEKMFQVVEPTLRSLAGEIQRTAGYYKSLSRDVRIGRVFGIGHTFALPGMVDFLSRNVEMEVELVNAPQRVAVSPGVDTTWFAEEFPGMGAALGLALQALGYGKVEMTLLPKALLDEQQAGVRRWFYGVAAAAVVGTVAHFAFGASGASTEVDEQVEKMKAVITKVADQKTKVDEQRKRLDPRAEQLQRWAQMGIERGQYSEVLEKLLNAVDEYNRKLPEPPVPQATLKKGEAYLDYRTGEIILAAFYMSWENPLTLVPKAELGFPSDPELRKLPTKKLRDRMYVAAKFESRGDSFDPAVNFEKDYLKKVPGFETVRSDEKAKWDFESLKRTRLPYFDWGVSVKPEDANRDNAVIFWEVWQYVPAAAKAAKGAGTKAPM